MKTIFLPRFVTLLASRHSGLVGCLLVWTLSCRAALPNLIVNHGYASGVVTETADQTIGTSGTVQVSSGAQTTFNGGVKVTLSPGFSAQSGSYFHAAIIGTPLDSDGDGIPDYWEILFGLNPNNAADAALDPNGNGLTNLQEYAAGNNPLPSSLAYELHYDTNQRGQLTAIKKADNTPLAVYTYLVDQRRASRWLSNNTQTDYGYDGAGRMNLLDNYCVPGSSEIQKQEYGYDSRDRRTWTQRDGNLGDTYAYQADSQLTDFKLNASNPRTTPSGWTQEVSYAYDAVGNRTGVTNNGAVTSYSVDHANQYTAVTGATVQYGDGRGNVTQWNAWTYTYDADNRMLSATKTGMSITFAYDSAGRLVKRVTNGQTEFFCYDGAQQLMRTDQNATLLSSTIWGPNPDEVLIDFTPQNGNRYFHSDIQGTTLAVTDDNRVILERYRYDPYGNTTFYDASWSLRSATAYNVRFLYTGQERMASADGLYNYKNRLYSPELGRFLQSDPLRLAAGDNNLYRYCGNEPLGRTDPNGQFLVTIGFALWDTWQVAQGNITSTEYALRMGVNGAAFALDLATGAGGDLTLIGERVAAQSAIKVGVNALEKVAVASTADAVNAAGHVMMSAVSQTGSYTNLHQSGKRYHGKGPKERSQQSGREKADEFTDPHIATDWTSSASEKDALMDEARRIREDGGVDNPNNYNKINSPGEKLLPPVENVPIETSKVVDP